MFPQKWIICVAWVLIRISGITTYLMAPVHPAGRYPKHTNFTDVLKEGGKVMDNPVQGVKSSVIAVDVSSEIYKEKVLSCIFELW